VKLVFTLLAREDLRRLRLFIGDRNPEAARAAAARIKAAITKLGRFPRLGHPVTEPDGMPHGELRDLTIPFGAGSYTVRYQLVPREIRVLRIWHAREDRP
jgi:plasmid stabilization system protein ParE